MIGDILVIEDVEFEVVWDGGEGLIPDRPTKNIGFWVPPPRLYNKKSEYWTRPRTAATNEVDKPKNEAENGREEMVLCDSSPDQNVEYFGGSDLSE